MQFTKIPEGIIRSEACPGAYKTPEKNNKKTSSETKQDKTKQTTQQSNQLTLSLNYLNYFHDDFKGHSYFLSSLAVLFADKYCFITTA